MSATKPTEREKALEAERDDLQAKYDEAVSLRDEYVQQLQTVGGELRTVVAERDDYKAKYDEATKPAAPATEPAASTEPSEVDPHADARAALLLNKLERCFLMPDGSYCFDEAHARKFMGEEFGSLTVISAE